MKFLNYIDIDIMEDLIMQLGVHFIIGEHINDNVIDLAFRYEIDHNDAVQMLDEYGCNYAVFKGSNSLFWHIFTDGIGYDTLKTYFS